MRRDEWRILVLLAEPFLSWPLRRLAFVYLLVFAVDTTTREGLSLICSNHTTFAGLAKASDASS